MECASGRLSSRREVGTPWCNHCPTVARVSKLSPPREGEESVEACTQEERALAEHPRQCQSWLQSVWFSGGKERRDRGREEGRKGERERQF